jgi:hypothetical protein
MILRQYVFGRRRFGRSAERPPMADGMHGSIRAAELFQRLQFTQAITYKFTPDAAAAIITSNNASHHQRSLRDHQTLPKEMYI